MRAFIRQAKGIGRGVLLCGLVLIAGGSAAFIAAKAAPQSPAQPAKTQTSTQPIEKLQRFGLNAIEIPETLVQNMRLRVVTAAARTRPISLPPLQGCLALDNNRLARIHSRFAGEVVSIGTEPGPSEPFVASQLPANEPRTVRVGDRVRKGDLLAVVWSKDLGEKKSELVDAISKLRADEVTYRRLEAAFREGSIPDRSVRDAERIVESDRVAVERVERTLRAWRLTDEEIAAVRAEGDRLANPGAKRPDPAGWARVEVRSPLDGVIMERNIVTGDIVDTTADLFKVGDLSHLVVWVHVYEEDLPLLQSLPKPVRWNVRMPSRPGVSFPGQLEQVGAVIDPNQHTALVTGRVENPNGELKVGQFVTISVDLPPPAGEIELPADALVEDGRESVVFVRSVGSKDRFVRTPVRVTSRFQDVVCIRADGGVNFGDQVVTGGALLLRDAMDQLPVPQQ